MVTGSKNIIQFAQPIKQRQTDVSNFIVSLQWDYGVYTSTDLLGLHLKPLLGAGNIHHGLVEVLNLDVVLVHSDLQLLNNLHRVLNHKIII